MKKILVKLLILSSVIFLPISCSDDYLELMPTNQVSQADVFTTTTNAWGAINGIHRLMYAQFEGRQSHAGQSGFMIMSEMLGEDLVNATTGNGWFIAHHRWTAHRNDNSWETFLPYRFYYQVISNANMIIHNIDDAEGPASEKDHIKGQALAYRGWAYFNLVQLYGERYDWNSVPNNQLGVPLVLEPTSEGLPRETVENVYTQINLDLDEAIQLLDGKTPPPSDNRFSKSHLSSTVAMGIKARVALTQGNWALAASTANTARQGQNLMSHEEMLSGFSNASNSEFLWASSVQEDQTTYFYSFYAYMSWNFSSGNIRTNPKLINSLLYAEISDTDIRQQLWAETAEEAAERQPVGAFDKYPYHNFKFAATGQGDSRGDLVHMRTAELFLIEAEALARNNQYALAAQVLYDLISTRDDAYTLSTNTGQDLIDEIMIHRRIELWGEGFRWFDLKRLNLDLDRRGGNHDSGVALRMQEPAGSENWVYLIPLDEINANPLVEQN